MKTNNKTLNHTAHFFPAEFSMKEDSDKEYYSEGFIATTHPDRAENEELGVKGDILSEGAIHSIVNQLNNRLKPQAGAVSYRHDWITEKNPELPLSGVVVEAEVRKTEDGQLGAWVKTHHNKKHPDFEKTKYEVEHGYIPGYSIEYDTDDFNIVNTPEGNFRRINDLSLEGYGFADRRWIANPGAAIASAGYKEIVNMSLKGKEVEKDLEDIADGDLDETKKTEEIVMSEEDQAKDVEEKKLEDSSEQEKAPEEESKEFKISKEDYELLTKMKEAEKKSVVEKQIKEVIEKELKERAPMVNIAKTEKKEELKEVTAFKEAIKSGDVNMQWRSASRLLGKCIEMGVPIKQNSMVDNRDQSYGFMKENVAPRNLEIKELSRLQVKSGEGLQFDTNADGWTYGSYNMSPAEFNDIFQPVMVNQLNDMMTTYSRLQKKNFSGYSQILVRARDGANSTAGGYSEGANLAYATDFTGTVGRVKLAQPFSYYRVLVAVTGQQLQLAKSPGGIGDIWADEVKWSTIDLAKKLNQEILSTGDGTSESACLGFEGLILGTSGTLYGRNIATYTTLKSHKTNQSSAPISLSKLRDMIRKVTGGDSTVTNSNAMQRDLVFFTHPYQRDRIRDLIQSAQRLVPTSSRVGFEGMIEFDGVPVFADPDINTDDVFLIDTAHTYIAMNLPPTLELLPVTADAKAAHVKTYFNLFSDAPANNAWDYGYATS